MPSERTTTITIGFLTVVEHAAHGLFGGYLLLNHAGRPLEFHCTAPILPSRAQQILYGPTLEPFLYGEQIGATLVGKSTSKADIVLVDLPRAAAVREHIDTPVALVCADRKTAGDEASRWHELSIAQNRLLIPARYAADRAAIEQRLSRVSELFDLAEPFDRIREALDEAQRSTSKAA